MVKNDSQVVLHSPALRRFTKHLIYASVRQSTREEKIKQLGDEIDVDMILGHARHKDHVLEDINSLKDRVSMLSVGEKSLEVQQNHEFQKVDTMELRLQEVDEKIEALSHIAFMHAKRNREEIEEIKQKITIAHDIPQKDVDEIEELSRVTVEDEQMVRDILKNNKEVKIPNNTKIVQVIAQKKKPTVMSNIPILKVPTKVVAKPQVVVKSKIVTNPKIMKKVNLIKVKQTKAKIVKSKQVKPAIKKINKGDIIQIEKQIKDAEKIHKQLQKQGHPKVHLDKLKKMIDSHKKKLKELKK